MNTNELRISNTINHKEKGLITIKGITEHCGDCKIDTDLGWVYLKNCEPVPLTEEWLIKFGFKYNGWNYDFKNYVFHAQGKNEKGEFFNTEFGIKNNGITFNISYNLEFVHQLQNLYFALTGEELTIK